MMIFLWMVGEYTTDEQKKWFHVLKRQGLLLKKPRATPGAFLFCWDKNVIR
jgi:hypothetical protein